MNTLSSKSKKLRKLRILSFDRTRGEKKQIFPTLDWYYHPRMMNKSFEDNAEKTYKNSKMPLTNHGSTQIWFPDPEPEVFKLEYYMNGGDKRRGDSIYAENRLSARNLKPKHFAYYYRHFDRLDREYGKIFDLKTGRMYPEAKEKFWPDAIDNFGITKPDYINPRLKPENWRDYERIFDLANGGEGIGFRSFHPQARYVGKWDCQVPFPYSCS